MTQKLLGAAPSGATDAATKGYVDTSTTAGNGLTGGAGSSLNVGAGSGITVNADDVALASSAAGGGLTYTSGVLAVGAGSGITVNVDDVALASTTAGAGLTFTTGVLAVGANTGITVNADDIAVDYGPDPWKKQVRVATTANGTLSTAFANTQTVDGVTLATGDRILLKDQTTGADNGVYTVNASGAPTRAVDFDATGEAANGMQVYVREGTINAGSVYVMSNTSAPTIGTTALTFALHSSVRDHAVNSYTANRTLDNTDGTALVSAASGNVTITLPTAVGRKGHIYLIKRTDSTTANTVTVATTSSQTIDGATTYVKLWAQYTFVQVQSDNSNWQIIDQSAIDEPWQTASFASQWSNRGAGFPNFQFRRLAGSTDNVQIVGDVTFTSNGTTGLTSGATISTVPAAYRPTTNEQKFYAVNSSGTLAANAVPTATIDSSGAVKIFRVTSVATNGTLTIIQLNGIYSLGA
jgi:hypothetical protein